METPSSSDRQRSERKAVIKAYKAGSIATTGSFVERIYELTALGMVVMGTGFIVGPARFEQAPSYTVLRQILPIDGWAVLFLVIGVLKLAIIPFRRREWYRVGSVLGGTLCTMWCLGLILATVGSMGQWGSIPAWGVIAAAQLMSAASIWTR